MRFICTLFGHRIRLVQPTLAEVAATEVYGAQRRCILCRVPEAELARR